MSSPSSGLKSRRKLLPAIADDDLPESPSSLQSPIVRSKLSGDTRNMDLEGKAVSPNKASPEDAAALSGLLPSLFDNMDESPKKSEDTTPLGGFMTFTSFAVDRHLTNVTTSSACSSYCLDPFPNREHVENEFVVSILEKRERDKLAAIEAKKRAKEEATAARLAAIEAERRKKEEAEAARIAAIEAEKQAIIDADTARVAAEERALKEAEEADAEEKRAEEKALAAAEAEALAAAEAKALAAEAEAEAARAAALAAAEAEALAAEELDKMNKWLVARKFVKPSVVEKEPSAARDLLNVEPKQRGQCHGGRARFPLHVAVKEDNAEMVRILLAHGADASLTRGKLPTPVQLAKAQKTVNPRIVQHLLDSLKSATEEKDFN